METGFELAHWAGRWVMEQSTRPFAAMLGPRVASDVFGFTLTLLRQPPSFAALWLPPAAGGSDCRELANKLEAFEQFHQAPNRLGVEPRATLDPAPLLPAVWALGPWPAIFALEGLGYAGAEFAGSRYSALRRELPVPLTASTHRAWPEGASMAGTMLALHTGAALSFAGRWLHTLETTGQLEAGVWLGQWRAWARPEYNSLGVEGLGLLLRQLAPHHLAAVATELGRHDPDLSDLFWHGVGRGLYFAPIHALPWTQAAGRALAETWQLPADEGGRRNALAGLAWARTLVNLRHPEIVAELLRSSVERLFFPEAFSHGVVSALLVWRALVGRDALLQAFLAHTPSDAATAARWREWVVAPAEEAQMVADQAGNQYAALAERFRCPSPAGDSSRDAIGIAAVVASRAGAGLPAVLPGPLPDQGPLSLLGDDLKLVAYTLFSSAPFREHLLPLGSGQVMVTMPMTAAGFSSWIIARYFDSAAHPFPHAEKRYLRVSWQVLERWPQPEARCQGSKTGALRQIAHSISTLRWPEPASPPPLPSELAPVPKAAARPAAKPAVKRRAKTPREKGETVKGKNPAAKARRQTR